MRLVLASLLTMSQVIPAVAQSNAARIEGAEFFGARTYWLQKRDSCQPMIALKVRNTSSGDLGPIEIRMEVIDRDKRSVVASGSVSVPPAELPAGQATEIAIGGDHDISLHDCVGDMHELAFSAIHFAIRVTATSGPDRIEILRDEPMQEERVSEQN